MAFTKLAVDDNQKTLRLALAMRGGVSLAVWIGGVVAEIDLFRRASSNQIHPQENEYRRARAVCYAELLRQCTHYERVEIDILAGASAGGLNAVLYGLAQSCHTVMDETVRDTWITNGGIWELLRETGLRAVIKNRRVSSLLQGDKRFYPVVRDALARIAGQGSVEAEATSARVQPLTYFGDESGENPTLAVELAATLLEDIYNPERGNRASFSFRKTAGVLDSHFTTIPDRAEALTAVGEHVLDQMALAARSTSSFPGAFEPAAIHSATTQTGPVPCGLQVNMARIFPHARTENPEARNQPFNVVDGGIFDNIPIDRAIKAIRRAPASQPSERRLIYIDPEPPLGRSSATVPNQRVATSWISVIRSSMSLKQRNETAVDELGLIREHNDTVLRTRGRLEALAAALRRIEARGRLHSPMDPEIDTTEPPPGESGSQSEALRRLLSEESYRQCRIALDANRIADLLTDPWSELCQPPRRAVDYVALSPLVALGLKGQVFDAYNNRGVPADKVYEWSLSDDVYAMLDWVRLLIAWVHALENLADGLGQDWPQTPSGQGRLGGVLSTSKRRLYRYLTLLTEAKHLVVDEVLTEPLMTSNPPEERQNYSLTKYLVESHNRQTDLKLTEDLAELLRGEAAQDSDTHFYDLLAQWRTGEVPAELAFKTTLETDLDALRSQIAGQTSEVVLTLPPQGSQLWLVEWNESVYWHFYREPLKGFSIKNLSRLFAITGTPDTASIIGFDQITSNALPRIDIDTLRDGARAKHLGEWVRRRPTDEQAMVVLTESRTVNGADAKLAGNVLSRFGGFFLARWRENDWQWGRLDAAAGIAQILKNTPRNPSGDPETQLATLDQSIEELQKSILAESKRTTNTPNDQPAIAQTVGAETLDAIAPHYRFALASRIVPLIFRALLPPKDTGASIAATAARLGLLVAKPLVVPVPLIADPLRLALAVAVIVSAAGLLGAHNMTPLWQGMFAMVLIAMGGWIGYRAYKAHPKWREVGELLSRAADSGGGSVSSSGKPEDIDRWRQIFEQADTRRWRVWALALGIITIGVGLYQLIGRWWALPLHGGIPVENAVLAVCVVAGLQHWFNQRAHRVSLAPVPAGRAARLRGFAAKLRAGGVRSPQRSRVMRVIVACVIVIAALAGMTLSSLIADQHLEQLTRWPASGFVAGVAVFVLGLISLWGWVHNGFAVGIAVMSGVIAAGAQYLLDEHWPGGHRALFDFLPTVVWLVLTGFAVQYLPCRSSKTGTRNTSYGETGRPTIAPLYASADTT